MKSRRYSVTGVRLGEWNKATSPDCTVAGECAFPHIDVSVAKTITHERYRTNDHNYYNDIGLIRLAESVEYTDFIQPICLPIVSNLETKTNYTGNRFTVAGWGRTESNELSDILMKVNIIGVSKADCNYAYNQINNTITDNQLCAGIEAGKDSCQGDSGGPLMGMARLSKKAAPFFYVPGVVSYGRGCALEGWPGIYTRVGAYVQWIKSKLVP